MKRSLLPFVLLAVSSGVHAIPSAQKLDLWVGHANSQQAHLSVQRTGDRLQVRFTDHTGPAIEGTIEGKAMSEALGFWRDESIETLSHLKSKTANGCGPLKLQFRLKTSDQEENHCVDLGADSSLLRFYGFVSEQLRKQGASPK
jgi:hypothetical protein